MPEFVLNRNYVLPCLGHRIAFKKGQPTYVPPEVVSAAVAIGAVRADGKESDVLGPEDEVPVALSAEDREALVFAAFDDVIKKNDPGEFDAAGKPTVDTLRAKLDFKIDRKERDIFWAKHKEAKAIAAAEA